MNRCSGPGMASGARAGNASIGRSKTSPGSATARTSSARSCLPETKTTSGTIAMANLAFAIGKVWQRGNK